MQFKGSLAGIENVGYLSADELYSLLSTRD